MFSSFRLVSHVKHDGSSRMASLASVGRDEGLLLLLLKCVFFAGSNLISRVLEPFHTLSMIVRMETHLLRESIL